MLIWRTRDGAGFGEVRNVRRLEDVPSMSMAKGTVMLVLKSGLGLKSSKMTSLRMGEGSRGAGSWKAWGLNVSVVEPDGM